MYNVCRRHEIFHHYTFLFIVRCKIDAESQDYVSANQRCPSLGSWNWAIKAVLNLRLRAVDGQTPSSSQVWGPDHLSQGFGTFHWLVNNPPKVTATNYTTPKQTDAYPELDCALLHQKNIQRLHNHHLDDSNNMCVAHFSPEWPNACPLRIARQT